MRRPGGILHWQWGAVFAFSALIVSRWLAPEVAVYATAHSPCAPCGLRQEVAMSRLIPIHILAAPPSLPVEAIVPTLYDPEEFAALYHVDQESGVRSQESGVLRHQQAIAILMSGSTPVTNAVRQGSPTHVGALQLSVVSCTATDNGQLTTDLV
jgi:hypothetical protein